MLLFCNYRIILYITSATDGIIICKVRASSNKDFLFGVRLYWLHIYTVTERFMSFVLSVMQMQYFRVIKWGFSVRPPPRAKTVRGAFFFFSGNSCSVFQLCGNCTTMKFRRTQQELKWKRCALCAFHFRNYPCGHCVCSLHISTQITPNI